MNEAQTNNDSNMDETLYDKECRERAGTEKYYDLDGTPVKRVYSQDGKYFDIYIFSGDNWAKNSIDAKRFEMDAMPLSKEEFAALVEKNKTSN